MPNSGLIQIIVALIVTGLALPACSEVAPEEQPGPKVTMGLSSDPIFSPDEMSICDRPAGFCVDDWGISMEHTRQYLGVPAEESFMEKARAAGFDNFDGSRFTFSTGVYCDVNIQVCLETEGGDKPALNYSTILFPDDQEQ